MPSRNAHKNPDGVETGRIKALSAAEIAHVQEPHEIGRWLHIWRIACKWANISVFSVEDGTELYKILTKLPLYPYMKIKATLLCPLPALIEGG